MQYFRVKYRQFRKKSEFESKSHANDDNDDNLDPIVVKNNDSNDNPNEETFESDDEISKKFDRDFMVNIKKKKVWEYKTIQLE